MLAPRVDTRGLVCDGNKKWGQNQSTYTIQMYSRVIPVPEVPFGIGQRNLQLDYFVIGPVYCFCPAIYLSGARTTLLSPRPDNNHSCEEEEETTRTTLVRRFTNTSCDAHPQEVLRYVVPR
jgi:hypothetical protein